MTGSTMTMILRPARRRFAPATLLLVILATSAAGCGDDDTSAAPDASLADAGVVVPDTPAGQRLAWVLAALNGTSVTSAEVGDNFTAAFLAQVSAAQVQAVFAQLANLGPWTLVGFDGATTATSLVAITRRADGQYWRISLSTNAAEQNKIGGLLLTAAGDLDPALASFAAVDEAMQALAPQVNLLAATVDASGCTPLHELHPEASLAIGSAFKLYVLAALAQSIGAGERQWTDTIAIQDQYQSLPSGELQDEPDGTLLPVQTYAEKMISISDNTAADHLLFTVGRDAVEAMLGTTGHHDPTQDQPFLGTRELFILKLMLTPEEQQAYIAAPAAERRTLLAQYDATLDPRTFVGSWTTPRHIDKLEWFATPGDLCQVMRALKDFGDETATAPVYDVLALNPGIPDTQERFSYIGFKGGSEPGVLNLTWLVQRASDGEWRFLSLGFNDTAQDVPVDRIVYVATAARALLAE